MKNTHVLTVLTLVNFGMLAFFQFHQAAPAQASGPEQVICARALEIVDPQGKVRAVAYARRTGGPTRQAGSGRENLSGDCAVSADSSRRAPFSKDRDIRAGLGPDPGRGIDPTYIVISSDGGEASLTLTNKDGRRQVLKP